MKKTLKDLNFKNKKVLVRVDFNVPMNNQTIEDDTRIKGSLKTINYLIQHDAKIILFSHLGRVKKSNDKLKYSLFPIFKRLQELVKTNIYFSPYTRGQQLEHKINQLKNKEILLVENTRFEDLVEKRESKNNKELAKYWASLGDLFVNDAFGTAHRSHASNAGIATYIKDSCIGFLVEKELRNLDKCLTNYQKPYVILIGGAKVSDKITILDNLLKKCDYVLIGGGMAFTFLKALNYNVGNSLLEQDKVVLAKQYLTQYPKKIILPLDCAASKEFKNTEPKYIDIKNIQDEMGLDIGSKTINLFKKYLENAKTILWNGPMGVCEFSNYEKGTLEICKILAKLKNAYRVVGGGDSAAATIKLGFQNQFDHISTGGGASLEFLSGKPLIGLLPIKEKI